MQDESNCTEKDIEGGPYRFGGSVSFYTGVSRTVEWYRSLQVTR